MDDPQLRLRANVADLYERFPYPPLGPLATLFQKVRWEERQTLNYLALYGVSFGSTAGAAERPRILIAGCGTFEPIVVALANPHAEIVAIDLSNRSLELLKRNARMKGVANRILCLQADLLDLPESLGQFDFVIATGVLHHLPDPLAGFRSLAARSRPRTVFRFMVYSAWGRALLYATKRLAAELGVTTPAGLRAMIDSLPAAHPYKIYFHLYSDTDTDAGLADGYLHPCDTPFTARELGHALANAGLEEVLFLHAPEARPCAGEDLWGDLAVLEAFGELEENFRFVARRADAPLPSRPAGYEWNEALPAKGRLFSRLLGREISFDRAVPPFLLGPERVRELASALFLIPQGEDA